MLRKLGIAKSSYYYQKSRISFADRHKDDFNIISAVFNDSQQRYGYRHIKVMLKKGESPKSEPPYYDGMPVAWNISCTPHVRLVNIMLDHAISILPLGMHPVDIRIVVATLVGLAGSSE